MIVSSLWIVADVVACSASFCACWRTECGNLGAMLGHLVEQQLTLGRDQFGVGIGGRREIGHRIVAAGERRAQARDVEPFGKQIVAQMIALRLVQRSDRVRSARRRP